MQSNIDCVMDDLNEFPDSWVELANLTEHEIDLGDYSIGDSKKPAKAYKLPSQIITSGDKVLIYCDKVGNGLHTGFRLESGKGGEVYLFLNDEIVDSLTDLKKQPAPNVAYGRIEDGSDEWGYMAVATPGKSNCGTVVKELLPDPVFSSPGRIGTDPLVLSITIPEGAPEEAEIHYTLDGSEPTATSEVWTEDLPIEKSTVVRAVLICDGYITPRSVTHSYIFDSYDSGLQYVSLVTDNEYFYGDELGIYVTGPDEENPNYGYDWRRPVNIEFFGAKDTDAYINQLGETRVKGGATRVWPVKSLVLYANKRFGEKRFIHEFFPDFTPGIDEFKSLELRNSGNDHRYSMMRDVVMQESVGMNADLDWQPHQSMIIYVNGEYIGFMNLRPRANEDYIYAYYDGLEDIDLIENWQTAEAGSLDNFEKFKAFYSEKGHTLEEYRQWMDVEEFLNLFIMNIFYDNKDWPGNNIVQWRPLDEDGKWRWIAKDTDCGLGWTSQDFGSEYPTLKWVTNNYTSDTYKVGNAEFATLCFKNMIEDSRIRDLFVNLSAIYLGDFLRSDRIISIIDRKCDEIREDVYRMASAENIWRQDFDSEVRFMRDWVEGRVPFFYQDLADFFNLGKPVSTRINPYFKEVSDISINGVELSEPFFDGKWFSDSSFELASSDSNLKGWNIEWYINGETISYNIYPDTRRDIDADLQTNGDNSVNVIIPACDAVRINPLLYIDGVDEIDDDVVSQFDRFKPFEAFSVNGVNLGTFPNFYTFSHHVNPGIYVLRQGKAFVKQLVK